MKLPNRENAYIPSGKLAGYLLSRTHVVGRRKARFFGRLGFDDTNVDLLKDRLITVAQSQDVREVVTSPYGTKYVIERLLETPARGLVSVCTVWIVEKGHHRPRFVTAYPAVLSQEER